MNDNGVGNPNEQTPAWIIFNATLFWLKVALFYSVVLFIGAAIGDTIRTCVEGYC